jgi:type I restriction enzyme S subunit
MESKLPKNWKKIPLGEVCKLKNGYAFKSDNYLDKGIPVIRISDIKDGLIVPRNTVHVSENSIYDSYIINENEIIVAMSGATTGKFGIYKSKDKAYQNQRVGKFDIIDKTLLDNNFLLHQLHSLKRQIEKDAYGGAQPNISSKKIEEMEIVLPPLEIQQAIVSKIEELFSELDKGIEDLKTAQQQLKTYRQSVLKWAFEGKLTNDNVKEGELPKGWDEVEIKNVCENIKVGIVIKPTNFYSKDNSGIKTFRSANVREFQINDSNWVYFTEESNEINYRTKLKEDDVLLVRSGYPGTSCVVSKKFEGCNAIDILIATPNKDKILSKYLCCFNNSPLGKGMFRDKSRGVAQKHLNVGEYSKLKINIPSLEEQNIIVQEIESCLSVADKMEESIAQSLQQAEALRQSILKKAFSGELV